MNWVVMLTRNNLQLTRKAIETVRAQDIGPVQILIVDNGSEDETPSWLDTESDILTILNAGNSGVAAGWNQALSWVFSRPDVTQVLVLNNDIELRPEAYRLLSENNRSGFVTLIGDQDRDRAMGGDVPAEITYRPHPDFSAFLISKDVWEKVGYFDERFRLAFCEDWDYHCRLHEAGIAAECINFSYYHVGSATVKHASDKDARRIHQQAADNRRTFAEKWGFEGGTFEYYSFFGSSAPE